MRGVMTVALAALCLIFLVQLAHFQGVAAARMIGTGDASHKLARFLRMDPDCPYFRFHYHCYVDHPPKDETPSAGRRLSALEASHRERFLRGDEDCGYFRFHYHCYDQPPKDKTPSAETLSSLSVPNALDVADQSHAFAARDSTPGSDFLTEEEKSSSRIDWVSLTTAPLTPATAVP